MKKTCKEAKALTEKWAPAFGLGHYAHEVRVLPESARGKMWGRSYYNHEEEWFEFEVVPDGALPSAQVEALVLHELAHGLLNLASKSDHAVEAVCNRIVKLASRQKNVVHCNQHENMGPQGWPTEDAGVEELRFEPKLWMAPLVDALPEKEARVLNALYYERASLRVTAKRLGVDHRTVGRWRDKGLARLRETLEKLDGAT